MAVGLRCVLDLQKLRVRDSNQPIAALEIIGQGPSIYSVLYSKLLNTGGDLVPISCLRISAIVDACFRLIVDGVSAPSWTRRDARKRGFNVSQTPRSTVAKCGREALGFDFGLWSWGLLSMGPCRAAGGPPPRALPCNSLRWQPDSSIVVISVSVWRYRYGFIDSQVLCLHD